MNDASASRELIIVLAAMAALFLFGLAAVLIFVRTWRKEQAAGSGQRAADGKDGR